MNWLTTLPFLAALVALTASAFAAVRPSEAAGRIGRYAAIGAAATAWAGMLFLISRFVVVDLSYELVFLYTKSELPLRYRIAGAWTSREGSLLLWASYVATLAAIAAWRRRMEPWAQVALGVFAAAFLGAVWSQGTFSPTDPFFLQGRPDGNGLNPTLLSPFMLIHPPVMFLAYALTTVPAAAALGHAVTGNRAWTRPIHAASRLNWLLYTFAMGLGGIWAYYTLGFGGYWAWDPVEVANFLPWLALTAFLHAQAIHARSGKAPNLAAFLAILPLVLTMFSTISTRSGLWISVHAFTDPTNTFEPDAARRFLNILAVEDGLRFHVGLLAATLLAAWALWCRRLAIEHNVLPRASRAIAAALAAAAAYAAVAPLSAVSAWFAASSFVAGGRIGTGLLMTSMAAGLTAALPLFWSPDQPAKQRAGVSMPRLAMASSGLLALLVMVFLLFHIAAVNGWQRAFYDDRVPFLAAPVFLGIVAMQATATMGRRKMLVAVAAVAAVAVIAAIGALATAASSLAIGTVALAAGTVVVGLAAFWHTMRPGPFLLILAGLVNATFWLSPPSSIAGLHLAWPTQLIAGAAAFSLLWLSHRVAAGWAPSQKQWVALCAGTGLLGGFYVAPVLAAAAWKLGHDPAAKPRVQVARRRTAAIVGIHLALSIAFLGYAASTYFDDEAREELAVGQTMTVGGHELHFTETSRIRDAGTPYAASIHPTITIGDDGEAGAVATTLYWEPQTGSHYPLPATLRLWHRDIYLDLDGICVGRGSCEQWITSYDASARVSDADDVYAVRLHALSLPGISMVWSGLFGMLFYGLMAYRTASMTTSHESEMKPSM